MMRRAVADFVGFCRGNSTAFLPSSVVKSSEIMTVRALFHLLFILLLAACGRAKLAPTVGYRYLDLAVDETFDQLGGWRSYDGGETLYMNVETGVYRMVLTERQYVWTQADSHFRDVVIEAAAAQISDEDKGAFGIACRLDAANRGRGYFFLISGDGHYSIRWSDGRALNSIVTAQPSDSIQRGQAVNRIRAVCIDDYLALWINGQFAAEAHDSRAAQGMIGLAGVMNAAGRLEIEFDDLKAWPAAFDNRG